MDKLTVWCLLLMSSLPASLPQPPFCNPFTDHSCSVSSCLICGDQGQSSIYRSSISATCEQTPLDATTDSISCVANISSCHFGRCDEGNSVCVSGFDEITGRSSYHAFCFDLQHTSTTGSCDPSRDCVYGGRDLDRVSCCCIEDDCLYNVLSLNVSSVVVTDAITTMTSDPTSDLPSSGSHTLSIVIGIIGSILGVVVGVAIVSFLCYFRHHLWKLNCCRHCRRRKTSQTGIERAFSGRAPQPWVLQGMVGQGRFGHVYKALYNGDVVAVKVYSHHNRTTWENERNLFALESTHHDNIVHFVTSDIESRGVINASQQQLYLVTSYYPLGSLEGYLRKVVLSWKQACVIVRSIACGLKYLHSETGVNEDGISYEKYSIAHRDIKSSNILVRSETGECVIADLGLALQLIPTDNPSNYGQVGTARYMSPEALEARVNLLDMQAFKQIDIYAFSLVMWEVMSRCCVLTPDEVGEYQLPYADLVVHPTLEVMKDIVCSRQLRPSIPSLWSNHEPLIVFAQMISECWDADPESRLTAANIHYQMDDLCNCSTQNLRDQMSKSHTPTTTTASHAPLNNSQSHPPDVRSLMFHREHSQSSPPPCYSPTDPIPFSAMQNQEYRSGMRPGRNSSMPHIMQGLGDEGRREGYANVSLTPRCTRSLRSSTIHPPSGWAQYYPNSVRNSLVLQIHDDPLPTSSDEDISCNSQSIPEMGVALDQLDGRVVRQSRVSYDRRGQSTESNASSKLDLHIPNADSGIQVISSNTSQSTIHSSQSSHTLVTPTDTPTTDRWAENPGISNDHTFD